MKKGLRHLGLLGGSAAPKEARTRGGGLREVLTENRNGPQLKNPRTARLVFFIERGDESIEESLKREKKGTVDMGRP